MITRAGDDRPSKGAAALDRLAAAGETGPLDENPQLRAFFACWLDTFVFEGTVDPWLRELAILRVMWRCGQSYEWGNHYRLARQAGCSDDDVRAIETDAPDRDLEGPLRVVVRAADEVVDLGRITPETLAACEAVFPAAGVLHEFLYLVAGYRMIATVSASIGREATTEPWPPDGVGPRDGAP